MASSGSKVKKVIVDISQKKIPQNPKYKDVRPTIDTGASLSKYMRRIEDIRQNYRYRPDEIFKRMKVTTFVQLAIQVYRISESEATDFPNGRPDTADSEVERISGNGRLSPAPSLALTDGDFGAPRESGRSTLQSVAAGIGELDLNKSSLAQTRSDPALSEEDRTPYLLLDVRDKDEYDVCHIKTAVSYSKAYLSRATNYESKEMLAFRNKTGKVIILYDEDERIAPMAATTLVQRGYDNLFMLSGGLKVASKAFREGLLSAPYVAEPTRRASVARIDSNAPSSAQKSFTSSDVDKMEIYLDNILQNGSSSSSSRLSKASSSHQFSSRRSVTSASSNVSKVSSASTIEGRPPFRPV